MKIKSFLLLILLGLILSCKEGQKLNFYFPENVKVDTIPFSFDPKSKLILLEVCIQDHPYQLIFDTGCPTTLLDSSIPVKEVSSDTLYFKDLLNRKHSYSLAVVDTLRLGKMRVINHNAYRQRKLNLDGIMGEDLMENWVWKIDLLKKKLQVSKDVEDLDHSGISLPLKRKGQFIYLTCLINGKELDLMVDTGFNGFVSIDRKTADSLSFFGKTPVFWEGKTSMHLDNPFAISSIKERIDSTYYLTGNLQLGDISLSNEIIELRNNSQNLIGMDFFRRFDYIILDYPNRKIHFGKPQHKSLNFLVASVIRLNTMGVILIPSPKHPHIGRVTEWAKAAGINYMDTLVSIDGISIINQDSTFYKDNLVVQEEINHWEFIPSTFTKLFNDFHFENDTSHIGIKKGNQIQNFTLVRQYNFLEMPDSIQDYYLYLALPPHQYKKNKKGSATYYTFKTSELLPSGLRKKLAGYYNGQELVYK